MNPRLARAALHLVEPGSPPPRPTPRAWLWRNLAAQRPQLFLWTPVLFLAGIGGYFALASEPPWSVLASLALILAATGWALRRRSGALLVAALGLIVAGVGVAKLRTMTVAAPIIEQAIGPVFMTGVVVDIRALASRPHQHRLLIAPDRIDGLAGGLPNRLDIIVRTPIPDWAAAGDRVTLRAMLTPPRQPAIVDGYDPARAAYFSGIGGQGHAVSRLKIERMAQRQSWRMKLNPMRIDLARRIEATIGGDAGGVAAALITGRRDGVNPLVVTQMRDAGLAHLLAISGLHLALAAGGVFFGVRAVLAVFPGLALRLPIKAIAAVMGMAAATFYLLLSGAGLPTQRAYAMAIIAFLAVLLNRRAVSLRLAALAAWAVLLFQPEAALAVGFQMSFAAVIGLIAAYEAWARRPRQVERGIGNRLFGYFAAIVFSTLIAEIAIAPIAAFHFNRFQLYGLAANFLVMPLVGLLIMPMGLVAMLLMPLGLDAAPLWVMGKGIDAMLKVAADVAAAPGALVQIPALPLLSALLIGFGGLWLCLWRGPLRWLGPVIALAAIPPILLDRPADILVAAKGEPVAVRDEDGRLYFADLRGSRTARALWLNRNAQQDAPTWRKDAWFKRRHDVICAKEGCRVQLHGPQGQSLILAQARTPQALVAACGDVDIVVSRLAAPADCWHPLLVVDHDRLARTGSHAIWLNWEQDGGVGRPRVKTVAARGQRPWTGPVQPAPDSSDSVEDGPALDQ